MMRENLNKKEIKVMGLEDKKVLMNGSDYIELESVGSALTVNLMFVHLLWVMVLI